GLIAGIFPALQASKTDAGETLKAQSTAGEARSGQDGARRALSALVITELALTLILFVGAGLMIKSLLRPLARPKGFKPHGVLALALSPNSARYPPGSPQRGAYFQESLDRVQALPGIQSVGLASSLPIAGPTRRLKGVEIEGRSPYEPGKEPVVDGNVVSPGYFQTMGIQMRAGRSFTSRD